MGHPQRQMSLLLAVLLALQLAVGERLSAQQTRPALSELVSRLSQVKEGGDPLFLVPLSESLASAPLAEIKANLPALLEFTDSPNATVRGFALLSLTAIEGRRLQGAGNRGPVDAASTALLAPYIPRIAGHFTDPLPANRNIAVLVLNGLAGMRPAPPVLLDRLFDALADPSSTTPPVAPAPDKYKGRPTFALGPLLVSVLLTAGASFQQDPVTHITEGTLSPEVQQHLLAFLHRPDQTPASLAETVHALAIAQPQSVAVNADLLRLFDSPDEPVRYALLHDIQRLTLTPSSFAQAQERVRMLTSDPAASERVRAEAQRILPCWNNDRHHPGCSPY